MSEKNIVRKSAEEIDHVESRTDWDRIDALTDKEIEQAVEEDPDAELLDAKWFQTAQLVIPAAEEKRINLRLDEDIIAFFKEQNGEREFEARINEILRAHMLAHRLKKQREALDEESDS